MTLDILYVEPCPNIPIVFPSLLLLSIPIQYVHTKERFRELTSNQIHAVGIWIFILGLHQIILQAFFSKNNITSKMYQYYLVFDTIG